MGSEGTPEKPKPGSLKDRIAAFNQQAAQQVPPSRPAPAPKPANWSWKQKQTEATVSSPYVAPAANASVVYEEALPPRQVDERADKKGGMSASDAKESIQKGQSLKERMAALKGQGAFGGDPAPKPPVAEKPRVWKKVVVPELVTDAVADSSDVPVPASDPSPVHRSSTEVGDENDAPLTASLEEVDEEQGDDEEERERQRRAAIAARMAKLGGARVGMAGPPVFGRPAGVAPRVKSPPSAPREDDVLTATQDAQASPASENVPTVSSRESNPQYSAIDEDVETSTSKVPLSGVSPSGSVPPADIEDGAGTRDATPAVERKSSAASEGKSQPLQVPRRALPPRKKSSKKLSAEAKEAEQAIVADTPSTIAHGEAIPDASPVEDEQNSPAVDATDSVVDFLRITSIAAEPEPDSVDVHHGTSASDYPVPRDAVVHNAGVTPVLSSEAEVYEDEDEDENEHIGSAPSLTHLEDATNLSRQPQPKVEYVELEQHLQPVTYRDAISPVSESLAHQPPARYSLPPPPRPTPAAPAPEPFHGEDQDHAPKILPPPPPRMLGVESDNEDDHQSDTWDEPSSPALRTDPPIPKPGPNSSVATEAARHEAQEEAFKPPPVNRASRPPVPQSYSRQTTNEASINTKRRSIDSMPSSPLSPQATEQSHPVSLTSSKSLRRTTLPPPPPVAAGIHKHEVEESERELMDEADTDPIDPSFFSPPRSVPPTSAVAPHHIEKTSVHAVLDEDAAKRRVQRMAIAERMAKLGDIKFGAPVLPPPPARKQTQASSTSEITTHQDEPEDAITTSEEPAEETEEQARARRAAIAARLAGQGGMRFGMIPAPPPSAIEARDQRFLDELESVPESSMTSDDGVKVEVEDESEIEEVTMEEAIPPSVSMSPPVRTPSTRTPSAPPRPQHPPPSSAVGPRPQHPPLSPAGPRPHHPPSSDLGRRPSQKRPPIPSGINHREKSGTSPGSSPISPRSGSFPTPNADYVFVDEPEESMTSSRPVPNRRPLLPPPPPHFPPSSQPSSVIAPERSQWELPAIPSSTLDMGDGTHSDDDTIYPIAKSISPSTSSVPPAHASPTRHSHDGSGDHRHRALPTSDELIALWGKIGTQVIAHAEELVETSTKSVIGDGSAEGFVRTVLDQVPGALNNDSGEYGHVIFSQLGASVQKRASDIMPGDVIVLQDARFKGHKGLSGYSWHVGAGDVPLVGIIHEFEGKKSKVRVFQATMHPNSYPSVESVSYRLEDLKSGIVKIYRVAEV